MEEEADPQELRDKPEPVVTEEVELQAFHLPTNESFESEQQKWKVVSEKKAGIRESSSNNICERLRLMPGFHPYVKLHLLRTDQTHETKPLSYAGENFRFSEEEDFRCEFDMKDINPKTAEVRVVIADSYFTSNNVLGFASTPIHFLLNVPNKRVYVKVITEEETNFAGNAYLQMCYNEDKNVLQIQILGCKNVKAKKRFFDFSYFLALIAITTFMIFNTLIIHLIERDNCDHFDDFSKCFWFTVVTFGSVGYGDMYPCSSAGQIVNGFIILFNQVSLACLFNVSLKLVLLHYKVVKRYELKLHKWFNPFNKAKFKVGSKVLCPDENGDRCTAVVQRIRTQRLEEVHEKYCKYSYDLRWLKGENQTVFNKVEKHLKKLNPLTFKKLWRKFLTSLFITFIFLTFFIGMGTFVFYGIENEAQDGLTYASTFHFCVVTMSTVGYGDWAPVTPAGQTFGAVFLIIGVVLLAHFASIVIDFYLKREELKNSTKFLNQSLVTPEQLLDFDMNGDREINKYEYLTKSLLACRFVDEEKIDLIMNKFMDIDTDKSGIITVEDFLEYTKNTREEVQKELNPVEFFIDVVQDIFSDLWPAKSEEPDADLVINDNEHPI